MTVAKFILVDSKTLKQIQVDTTVDFSVLRYQVRISIVNYQVRFKPVKKKELPQSKTRNNTSSFVGCETLKKGRPHGWTECNAPGSPAQSRLSCSSSLWATQVALVDVVVVSIAVVTSIWIYSTLKLLILVILCFDCWSLQQELV